MQGATGHWVDLQSVRARATVDEEIGILSQTVERIGFRECVRECDGTAVHTGVCW